MSQFLKPSFLQLPISKATDRVGDGGKSTDELLRLFHARAELEEKNIIFSLKSSNINIHHREIPNSTFAHAFGILKNYYIYTSRDQSLYHENLNSQVVKLLEQTKTNSAALEEHHKNLLRHSTRNTAASYESLEKAKCNHRKAEADLRLASEKLEQLSKNEHEESRRTHGYKKNDSQLGKKEGDSLSTNDLSRSYITCIAAMYILRWIKGFRYFFYPSFCQMICRQYFL